MSLSAIPKLLRKQITGRDAGICQYCRVRQFGQSAVFHVNHVLPRSMGGATHESNQVLQCPYCSLQKSNRTSHTDPQTGAAAPLFHPLTQDWKQHFRMERSGLCVGLTPTGRATVAALGINDPLPRIAREIQIELGILPLEQ